MVPASVRTTYAAQGESWHAVVADMARPPKMAKDLFWLACYVMVSRAKILQGLLFLRLPTMEELNTGPPKHILMEVDRLLALEQKSEQDLHTELRCRSHNIPECVRNLFEEPKAKDEMFWAKRLRIKKA